MRATMCLLPLATALAVAVVAPSPAEARCTRLAYSVNDYGKDGPTRDALKLLDRYIADWAAKQGIKQYSIGKRDVSCELFLDFGFFDEHTCKASALVCWGGSSAKGGGAAQGGGQAPAGGAAAAGPAAAQPKAPAQQKAPAAQKAQPAGQPAGQGTTK